MSFTLTEEQLQVRDLVRRVARERVAPYAAIVDSEQRPPIEALTAGLELGLPGLPYPEKFGGQAGDIDQRRRFFETFAHQVDEIGAAADISSACRSSLGERIGRV